VKPFDLPLTCACGTVQGMVCGVTPDKVTRVVCMCDDCQAYAHHLGQASTILDAHGGTDVFLTVPARTTLLQGLDQVRCLQLSPKGLLRWYAGCCLTPMANTLRRASIPFVGIHAVSIDRTVDLDQVIGPVCCHMQGRFGIEPLPVGARQRASAKVIVRATSQLLWGWMRGQARPHPFFSADTGLPVVTPTVVPADERQRLRSLCGPRA